jgi:hypothetical protein
VRDRVLLLEVCQFEVRCDLAELVVFFEQFGDFGLVGALVDLVGAVEFLDVVHQAQDAVDLLLVLESRLLGAR